MKVLAIVAALIMISTNAYSKRLNTEYFYQNIICKLFFAEKEVILLDKTRVDCLNNDYAIEIDFADKWSESIGQALHYSMKTKKKAGIVLILEKEDDIKYVNKLKKLNEYHGLNIKIWNFTP